MAQQVPVVEAAARRIDDRLLERDVIAVELGEDRHARAQESMSYHDWPFATARNCGDSSSQSSSSQP